MMSAFWLFVVAGVLFCGVCGIPSQADGHLDTNLLEIVRKSFNFNHLRMSRFLSAVDIAFVVSRWQTTT